MLLLLWLVLLLLTMRKLRWKVRDGGMEAGAREQAGKHFHQKSKVRGSTGCGGSSERDIHHFGTKRQSRNWSWYSTFTYLVKVVSTLRLHQRVKLKMKLK